MSNDSRSKQVPNLEEKGEDTYNLNLQGKAALVRTMLAADNSLMAWIRTSISLYAFGFSIITFFDYMGRKNNDIQSFKITMLIGLALLLVGIISLILAMIDFKYTRRKLLELGLPKISRFLLPIRTAMALIIIAVFSLGFILFNISVHFL